MKVAFHKIYFYMAIRVVGIVNLGCLATISFRFSAFSTYLLCVLSPSEVEPAVRKLFAYFYVQDAYKLSDYFAKLEDRCIICNEVVHSTFGSTSQEDHDVQIAVGTRDEPPQIPGHTNYAR
jgi:hypothetical protein